ncbi:ABC transporter substrate-binding protein [Pseudoflavonifractor phocaeensis]|uniref:ABC transporter substrate-binding protein n=1 Tax=Pseudoflavonifractor phocaeensis TaxID=1870988 RepID=UPI001F1742FE|nr:ABC transporter substrate-binding protein [Pseudoflavonifractor phocaeensis]MCF2596556.1 ABC transporter substrate-binding protein [Pseudoflavonifractor phocaeensis]
MKKFLSLALAVSMALSLVACGGSSSGGSSAGSAASGAASGDKVVKIGVYEPQTGDNGAGGKKEILGMQYANTVQPTVEIGGETYQVQLEIVDNRTTPENGPSAASELVNRGASIVLGSYGSGVSMAGGKVFEEAGVPAIGVTCTNPQVTADCSVYHRICFLDPFQGTVLANYAYNELGVTTAYTLAMLGSDYDQGLVHYFSEAFTALGGTVKSEDFPEGSANFVSYINNAKAANAGVIFAPVSINYAQLIVEAADAQGFEGALLGSDTWDDNMVIESAKGRDVNVYVTTFYQEGGNAEFDSGIKEWINANADAKTNNGGNDMISAVTAMGYDAYFTALEAIKAAGSTDPAAVLEALPGVSYEGVSGLIEFDEIGDAKRDSAFIKTANTEAGAWDFVKVQTVG